MASPVIKVTGLREVVRSLEKLGIEVADLKAGFNRIGGIVADEAKDIAPRLSGALAASVRPSKTKNKAVIRAGGSSVPYAGVIHFGGGVGPGARGPHNIEPQPFLYDAIEGKDGELLDALDDELNTLISRLDLR